MAAQQATTKEADDVQLHSAPLAHGHVLINAQHDIGRGIGTTSTRLDVGDWDASIALLANLIYRGVPTPRPWMSWPTGWGIYCWR
ncbi:hypothetical protein [Nonomuraea sp. NPDC048901]|uniref:hypothetical protein n=1 Tax=Nonomuraea sp. NPDC048901 TaxID=3155627 RepID=UPI0033FF5013